jgi:hypothetical protein
VSKYANGGPPVLRNLKDKLWRVEEECWIDTGIKGVPFALRPLVPPGQAAISVPCTWHSIDGRLHVKPGYVGDGSSIPLVGRWLDGRGSQWPWLVHDIAYEASRAGIKIVRWRWDELYSDMARAFGNVSTTLGEWALYYGLRLLGAGSASPRKGPEYPVRVERGAA